MCSLDSECTTHAHHVYFKPGLYADGAKLLKKALERVEMRPAARPMLQPRIQQATSSPFCWLTTCSNLTAARGCTPQACSVHLSCHCLLCVCTPLQRCTRVSAGEPNMRQSWIWHCLPCEARLPQHHHPRLQAQSPSLLRAAGTCGDPITFVSSRAEALRPCAPCEMAEKAVGAAGAWRQHLQPFSVHLDAAQTLNDAGSCSTHSV